MTIVTVVTVVTVVTAVTNKNFFFPPPKKTFFTIKKISPKKFHRKNWPGVFPISYIDIAKLQIKPK